MSKYHTQSIMGILFSSEAQKDSYHGESRGPEERYGSDFLTPGKWGGSPDFQEENAFH